MQTPACMIPYHELPTKGANMKKNINRILLGLLLVSLSIILYLVYFAIFGDSDHIFIFHLLIHKKRAAMLD